MTDTCPTCNRPLPEQKPQKPQKPYEYTGMLKPYLNSILLELRAGEQPKEIAKLIMTLGSEGDFVRNPDYYRYTYQYQSIIGLIKFIAKRYGIPIAEARPSLDYYHACWEHVFLLRCEGLTFKEISLRMGLSTARCHEMADLFARKMNKSMRRVNWKMEITNEKLHTLALWLLPP